MSEDLAETVASVRDRVRPTDEERERLERTVEALIDRTEDAVRALPVEADVVRVGSTARDTWLRGDRDIDIFVRFSPDLEAEDLERYGLDVGQAVLPDGRLEYAEHPYVTAEFEEYSVDLVPCFRVESGAAIRSSVDRTPFHAWYVAERLTDELANDVRVLKRFCEATGIYGSDLRTCGFSGYLTELLVLEYGGFAATVEAAADWHPPVRLDPADHGDSDFDDPLVVIDPTDPNRNVAAVVSARNVARFQHYSRALLANPDVERFSLPEPSALSEDRLRAKLERRETTPMVIAFPAPGLVEDQLYPQLRTSRTGIVAELADRGFDVLRSAVFAHDRAAIYLELAVPNRPAIERHEGPPVHVREHAAAFLEKWADADVYGPFIDENRYVVEREREVGSAAAFLRSDRLFTVGLGADIRRTLADGYDILVGDEVLALLPEFETELAAYYDPKP